MYDLLIVIAVGGTAIWVQRLLDEVGALRAAQRPLSERRFTVRRIHDTSFALTEEILAALAGSVPPETAGNLRVEFYAMIREAVSRHEEQARLERKRLRPLEKED